MTRCVLVTGASGAIGGALALEYAGPGVTLVLQGRKADALHALAAACRARGAVVCTHALDLRDRAALATWLDALAAQHAFDLLIVCAGVNTHVGPGGEPEPWDEVEAVLQVNLEAAVRTVHRLLPGMRQRGGGQIALIGSLAGCFGLPLTPAYSASKAGLKAYGEALRGWLAPQGIRVSVVLPGYVQSPMCEAVPGPKPWVWSPARAARAIQRGLARDAARISFPFPLNWGMWWLAVLPAGLSVRIVRWLGYGVGDGAGKRAGDGAGDRA